MIESARSAWGIFKLLDFKRVRYAFNRAAESYDEAAILQRELAGRLIERLDYMSIDPKAILNVGARTGFLSKPLQTRYPKASIISQDFTEQPLKKNKAGLNICSAYEALPFQDN